MLAVADLGGGLRVSIEPPFWLNLKDSGYTYVVHLPVLLNEY